MLTFLIRLSAQRHPGCSRYMALDHMHARPGAQRTVQSGKSRLAARAIVVGTVTLRARVEALASEYCQGQRAKCDYQREHRLPPSAANGTMEQMAKWRENVLKSFTPSELALAWSYVHHDQQQLRRSELRLACHGNWRAHVRIEHGAQDPRQEIGSTIDNPAERCSISDDHLLRSVSLGINSAAFSRSRR